MMTTMIMVMSIDQMMNIMMMILIMMKNRSAHDAGAAMYKLTNSVEHISTPHVRICETVGAIRPGTNNKKLRHVRICGTLDTNPPGTQTTLRGQGAFALQAKLTRTRSKPRFWRTRVQDLYNLVPNRPSAKTKHDTYQTQKN